MGEVGFKLKCTKCGKEVEISRSNIDDVFIILGYNTKVEKSDMKEGILIYHIEEDGYGKIRCVCGNEV